MTVNKWFTPPARAHGNASHHHTHGQGMCGGHWEHLGPFPYAVFMLLFTCAANHDGGSAVRTDEECCSAW